MFEALETYLTGNANVRGVRFIFPVTETGLIDVSVFSRSLAESIIAEIKGLIEDTAAMEALGIDPTQYSFRVVFRDANN